MNNTPSFLSPPPTGLQKLGIFLHSSLSCISHSQVSAKLYPTYFLMTYFAPPPLQWFISRLSSFLLWTPLDCPIALPAFPSLNTCFLLIHFPPGSQRDLFKIINQIVLLLDFKTFSDSALGVKAKLLTWPPNPEAVWSLPSPAAHRPPLSLFTILQLLWHSCRLMNGPSSFLSLLRSLFHLFLTRVITPTGKPSLTTPAIYIWPLLRLPYNLDCVIICAVCFSYSTVNSMGAEILSVW